MSGGNARMSTLRDMRFRSLALLLLGLFVCGIIAAYTTPGQSAVENTMLTLFPSADRAYAYGTRHFDARDPAQYDMQKATYFFQKAAELDPNKPEVLHQIARLYFLEGDFDRALSVINLQIALHGDAILHSFYMRGLIEGYMGRYDDAAQDYAVYLEKDPENWAAINDYAWILLKAGRAEEAASALEKGLSTFPDNPWLLNSYAIAELELENYDRALTAVKSARFYVQDVTEIQWLMAYPGNDPRAAKEGLDSFKTAVDRNMHSIETAFAESAVQL